MADTNNKGADIVESPVTSGRTSPRNDRPNGDEHEGNGSHQDVTVAEALDESKKGYFAYFHTREFYVVLLLGKRPLYEVLGQLGLYATVIMGVQAAIFDRGSFQTAKLDRRGRRVPHRLHDLPLHILLSRADFCFASRRRRFSISVFLQVTSGV
ncbi:DUF914 domain membrane protein [Coccidioides immitis H538.4]|uniref:DUF914 domain membrane protein n=1 Tax=Coccidioides immitis H538.4 TaxID=396776 RepID=A0A0J8RLJ4_COCIT|nr:DUF914 domain membrane protein [Coccidioides immitis H538.4]